MNRKYCILLMHSYYGKVWWCQFGLTAIKKNEKKPNTLHDKETFLSAKSWIFTIEILWGWILQNWGKRQKTELSILNCSIIFKFIFSWHFSHSGIKLKHAKYQKTCIFRKNQRLSRACIVHLVIKKNQLVLCKNYVLQW